MPLTEEATATSAADTAAIAELDEIVDRQRAAFLADPFPSLEERQALLGALAGMVMGHRTEIQEAMSADFGVHPTAATDLIEVLGVAGRAGYAAEQLEAWMEAEPRDARPGAVRVGSGVRPGRSRRASSGTSCPGTSRSTSRSGRWSRCSRPATAS